VDELLVLLEQVLEVADLLWFVVSFDLDLAVPQDEQADPAQLLFNGHLDHPLSVEQVEGALAGVEGRRGLPELALQVLGLRGLPRLLLPVVALVYADLQRLVQGQRVAVVALGVVQEVQGRLLFHCLHQLFNRRIISYEFHFHVFKFSTVFLFSNDFGRFYV